MLDPDLLEKFRQLPVFAEAEEAAARKVAQAEAEAEKAKKAEATAKKAQTAAKKAEAKARKAEAAAEARAAKIARDTAAAALTRYFTARGDKPSAYAYNRISACQDAGQLQVWLDQAYEGATAAEIFPEP